MFIVQGRYYPAPGDLSRNQADASPRLEASAFCLTVLRMVRFLLFGTVLFLWLAALLLFQLCANDMLSFQLGRDLWFARLVNGTFLVLSVVTFSRLGPWFKERPKTAWSLPLCFLAILLVTELWIPLVASITGPPWQNKVVQVPVSADTPYMDSIWAWQSGEPRKAKTNAE